MLNQKIQNNKLALYIHYPFCKSKCPYCDFNSHVRDNIDYEKFARAYENEIDFFAPRLKNREIETIFFGGGTPSLMPEGLVARILAKIANTWNLSENCEVTLETNPTSFEAAKFKAFKALGVNRLSIGIQSLNDADLKFLGREHSSKEAIATIVAAAKIFDNFSFDLIYARPTQTLESWSKELRQALDFGSKHLSLYQLTIEKGTKFFSEFQQKKFIMPDENLAADFYEMTNEITSAKGFELYEISNYAKKGFECKHNLVYWQGGDYLGIGAGAHSRVFLDDVESEAANDSAASNKEKNRSAIMMLHEPNAWLQKATTQGAAIQTLEKISPQELLEELILMGLRLKTGINNKIFQDFFAKNITEIFDLKKLQKLADQGLIEFDSANIKISDKGRILSNAIIAKVIEALQ